MKGEEIEKRDSSGQYKRPRQAERKFPSPSETRERAVKIGDPTKIKIPIPEETPSEDLEKINVGQAVRGFGRGLRNIEDKEIAQNCNFENKIMIIKR